ncbi:putative cytochrome c assembly protein [Rosa chinensis]|uniref:Putative cytochrome c assembly protein n=1 Tax=Rosa chinensis TaxID=74649 RepID=A0A2P6Q6E8_ROSCH|nr:putative cytochrome c assembly protein [Rosa chinensis]
MTRIQPIHHMCRFNCTQFSKRRNSRKRNAMPSECDHFDYIKPSLLLLSETDHLGLDKLISLLSIEQITDLESCASFSKINLSSGVNVRNRIGEQVTRRAALLCGSLLSLALLVITFRKFIRIFSKSNNLLTESFSFGEIQYVNERNNVLQNTSLISSQNYYRYQLIQQLDRWSYRIISLGFILLTIGILSGAVWANEAWGSYWNWDPKETWAFITWTIFAIYLHIRTNKNYESVNSAIVASMGFLIIWICYFGVNLLGIGLHSYGSFTLPSN